MEQNRPARTTSWYCDSCKCLIARADHGYLEWINSPVAGGISRQCRNFRIVHHLQHSPRAKVGCQFGPKYEAGEGTIGGFALTEYRGRDGLMQLLEMIAEGESLTKELLEIIKRIHIPGYEHARRDFDRALAAGAIEPDVTQGFWRQDDIQRVLEFVEEERDS